MSRLKRTKIIATLGPASEKPDIFKKMLAAGLDIIRLNFSHGTPEEHGQRINMAREQAVSFGKEVAVLADLQGPKIRIARFKQGPIELKPGDEFVLDANLDKNAGDQHGVGIDYKELPQDVAPGDVLLLDDGRLELQVDNVTGSKITCRVKVGGHLSNNKGINRLGGGLSAKALTPKDKTDLVTAVKLGADYIAISFPRDADDVHEARELVKAAGGNAGIIAKIERTEAINNLDEIIKASDGVMVARGDLGVEIGDAEIPGVQKHIIHQARSFDRPVITATQMMESMIHSPIPTRAEVSDVANAVLDGTDAVMLSAESAVGDFPDKVIEAMSRICLGAEKQRIAVRSKHRMDMQFERVDEAVAMATMYTANHLNIKAIIALTESGSTPLWMSRIRSGIPIYALSRHVATRRRVTLYRGVYPIDFDVMKCKHDEVNSKAIAELEAHGILEDGDLVILTKGDVDGVHGGSNVMKILRVGRVL